MGEYGKVRMPLARTEWRPSPLAEQVVLVTTITAAGEPYVSTRSRVAVVSYGPPAYVFFACGVENETAANAATASEFVVNVPSEELAATSWLIGTGHAGAGPERFARTGLTRIPSLVVRPPRIAECRAHLECRVVDTRLFGADVAVFGEVVAVSADEALARGDTRGRYRRLAPFFFLDLETTAPLGDARPVDEPEPDPRHAATVLASRDLRRAVRFYSRAFEWPIAVSADRYVEFAVPGGGAIALCDLAAFESYAGARPALPPAGTLGGVELYLRCDDIELVAGRLFAAGARALAGPAPRDWGDEVAYFADPDGNVIALARRLPPAAAGR